MTDSHLLNVMQEMLFYVMTAVCIVTIPVLIVGLCISIVQTATQLNEMTMTFIPKFVVMFFLLSLLAPWLLNKLILLTQHYFTHLAFYIR